MKTLHLRWMAAALTAALCLTVLIATQTHPAQAQAINCADTAATGIPQAECAALVAMYETGYPPGETGELPCDWTGITCTGGRVTAVELYAQKASQPVPNLSALTQLANLRLIPVPATDFYFSGNFPLWIASSASIKTLDVSDNHFYGTMPSLSAMTALETLSLKNVNLPNELPALPSSLKSLDASANHFYGAIPASYGSLTNLVSLNLDSNKLSGEIPAGFATKPWTSLSLSWNALFTTNPELVTLLNLHDPDFFATQTVPPADITVSTVSAAKATISWTPVTPIADVGGYDVCVGKTSGIYNICTGVYDDIQSTGTEITGMTPATTYYGAVRAYTDSHELNHNNVYSSYSPEFTFTTKPAVAAVDCADTATTGIPQVECEAVMGVTPSLSNGALGLTPCDWYYVSCKNGHVTRIESPGGQFTATMPDLSALMHLETLALWEYAVNGGLPAWIANSSTLKNVFLDNMGFSGPLPDLSAMTSLEHLSLYMNDFSGPFPDISGLTALQELVISENQFTGPLPDISQLPNLRRLYADGNQFTGTIHAGITSSTSLVRLALSNNELSGMLPDMSAMASLSQIYAVNNDLSGDLPPSSYFPPNIQSVDLSQNHFTGSIPSSYLEFPLQNGFSLTGNMLTGEIQTSPQGLHIWTYYNALTNPSLSPTDYFYGTQTLPPTGISASNVTHNSANVSWTPILYTADTGAYEVGLSTTSGSGYTFNHSTANKSATGINLSGLAPGTTYYAVVRTVTQPHTQNPNTVTSLNSAEISFTTGFDPNVINCANTALTHIPQSECEALVALVNTYGPEHFPSNWLSNTSPCTWSNLGCKDGHITGFHFVTAELGGPIPDLSALTHLSWLDLSWGNFSGSIPAWVTESTTLEFLNLGGNLLSGELPDFSGMTSLWQLFLFNNNFSGGFPSGVEHITILILSGNQLSGPIPDLDGTALRGIELSRNNFSGNLPQVHPETEIINFARNSLSGTIPESYGTLYALDNIDLSGNDLRGVIPAGIGTLTLPGNYDSESGLALNLSYNRLLASDPELIAKLTAENPDFFTTQTVAPIGMAVSNATLVSADLSWTPILYTVDAGAYEVGLSTTSGSGYIFNHSTANKSASGITLSGLTPNTTYYVVVRTVTQPHEFNPNTVTSLNSTEFSFTTLDPVSAPALLSPAANGVVRGTNSPVLSWLPNPAGEGVTTYRLLLKNDATGAKILKQNVSAATCAAVCTVDLGALVPQIDVALGVYNWQVTATGSLGATKSLKQRFSMIKPDAPVITAPLGTVSDPQPDLTWTVNPDDLNTRFKLKLVGVKSGLIFKQTVNGICSGAACAVGLDVLAGGPYLLNNDSYTLKVTAVNEIGSRKTTGMFKVRFPAPAVNLVPSGGTVVNTQSPVLSWTPDPNASSFRVILQRIKNGAVVKTYKVNNIVNGTQGFVCSAGTCTLDLASLASPLALQKGKYVWTVVSSSPAIHPTSTSKSAKAKFKIVLP